jgi:hypothetical protein
MTYYTERHQREFVDSSNEHLVQPLDCVPQDRAKGGWTKGVKAWKKENGQDNVVGWFTPPRQRNKKAKYSKRRGSRPLDTNPNKGEKVRVVNAKREWRKAWGDKVNRANMVNEMRQAEKGLDLDAMFSEGDEIVSEEE